MKQVVVPMDEQAGGGRGGRVMRWAAGAVCAFGVAVVCLAASPASAAAGGLDGTFGTGGTVTTDFAGNGDEARAVALQPDGKIVAAGGALGASVDFALARYRADGTPDTTFGTGGTVTTDFGGGEQAYAVAVQPDGKIVAAGGAATGFELARTGRAQAGHGRRILRLARVRAARDLPRYRQHTASTPGAGMVSFVRLMRLPFGCTE